MTSDDGGDIKEGGAERPQAQLTRDVAGFDIG